MQLIEVKSKSIDSADNSFFWTQKNGMKSEWQSYLFDIAFQKYVLLNAYPDYKISSYLMLVDKKSTCQTESLNQKFRIKKNINKIEIIIPEKISQEDNSKKFYAQKMLILKLNIFCNAPVKPSIFFII